LAEKLPYSGCAANHLKFSHVLKVMPQEIPGTIKALIVDDETDICFLLNSILKQRNVQAIFAGSLYEADKILERNAAPPIIFLDNHLPDGLGINYISKLKKDHPSSKIVMITAHDNVSDREKARIEGADFFIGKPFSRATIYSALDALAGQ
jgi:two-component system, OmpR family, response regulator